jgi:hypothetical protein
MARAAGVRDGGKSWWRWGSTKGRWGRSKNIIANMVISVPSRPILSVALVFCNLTAAHVVAASGFLLVALSWEIARGAIVSWVHVETVRPAIVLVLEFFLEGITRRSILIVVAAAAWGMGGLVAVKLGSQLVEFRILGRQLLQQVVVGVGKGAKYVAVGGSRRGQICKGFGGVGDERVHCIVRLVEAAALGSVLLDETIVLMCKGKVRLEVLPGVFRWRSFTPFSAGIGEYACVKHECVGRIDLLLCGNGTAASIGKVYCVIDLFNKCVVGRVGIPGFFESDEVFFEIMCCDAPMDAKEMLEQLQSGDVGISGVAMG